MALTHSNVCFSRRFISLNPNGHQYTRGAIKLASNMIVQDDDGRVLLTKRSPKMKVFKNAWVAPGGHIDLGESLEEGVVRELLEETGIEIEIQAGTKE